MGTAEVSTPQTADTLDGGLAETPSSVTVSPIDLGRDKAAAWVAATLVACFVLTLFLPAGAEMCGKSLSADVRSQLDKASTALIGLLGTVIAFYFSDKRLR